MRGINKSEFKFLIYATLFSLLLFVIVIPNFLGSIVTLSPVMQFLIFNIGIFIFLQIFLKSIALDKKVKFGYTLGIILLFMALDIIIPPLSISVQGTFASGSTLVQSSSDYILGLFWNSIGISGFLLFVFVYVVSPFILLIISSLLLKNFVQEL
jgi:hypothetical protein